MPTSRNARRFSKNRALILAVAALVGGCVTVNVNFPESVVQKGADDFVSDLYKPSGPSATDDEAKAAADSDSADVKAAVKKHFKKKAAPAAAASGDPTTFHVAFGFTEAYAQELNTRTPKAEKIKSELKPLIPEVEKWKSKGAVCETSDALLILKHPDKAGASAAAVAKLVKRVNELREQLYDEIASANNITDRSHKVIRKTFSTAFREHSPPGSCFEE